MRVVAIRAIFCHVRMFEDERPLLFHVASGAGILGGYPAQQMILTRPMHIVTIGAGDFLFPDSVMGELLVFCLDLGMAAVTELSHLEVADLLLWSLVKLMAVKATDVI